MNPVIDLLLVSDYQTFKSHCHRPVTVTGTGRLELNGTMHRDLHVEAGGSASINGLLLGALHVHPGARVDARGRVAGAVHVADEGTFDVLRGANVANQTDQAGRAPAVVVGTLRTGLLRYADRYVATEQRGSRRFSLTSLRPVPGGFVGDRKEVRGIQSWDEVSQRYDLVEVTAWQRATDLGASALVLGCTAVVFAGLLAGAPWACAAGAAGALGVIAVVAFSVRDALRARRGASGGTGRS